MWTRSWPGGRRGSTRSCVGIFGGRGTGWRALRKPVHDCLLTGSSCSQGLDNGSCVSREAPAQFCERVGVRLPRATHLVALFAYKDDAERVLEVLGKRLGKYGLQLHPDKTRMVDFRFRDPAPHDGGAATIATIFDFLGFTHVWVRSRKGKAVVRRQTAKARLARAINAIDQQCRVMRHWPLREQHKRLGQMLKGHFAYFGVTGNFARLASLYEQARRSWCKWLSRRSNNSPVSWAAFQRVLESLPLPRPRIVHRYTGS
jgi:RNA-directed DNA polymerase